MSGPAPRHPRAPSPRRDTSSVLPWLSFLRRMRVVGTVALSHCGKVAQQIFLPAASRRVSNGAIRPWKSVQGDLLGGVECRWAARFAARRSRDRSMQQCPAASCHQSPDRTSDPGQRLLAKATSSFATVAMSGQRPPDRTAITVVWLTSAARATSRIGRSPIAVARRSANCRAYSASIGPRRIPVGHSPLMRYSAGGRSPRCLGLMPETYRDAQTSCGPALTMVRL